MADQNCRLFEDIQDGSHQACVTERTDRFTRLRRGTESRQIEGHRIEALQAVVEISPVSPPTVQRQHLQRAFSELFTEDGTPGE
jgi:hypothetical protein